MENESTKLEILSDIRDQLSELGANYVVRQQGSLIDGDFEVALQDAEQTYGVALRTVRLVPRDHLIFEFYLGKSLCAVLKLDAEYSPPFSVHVGPYGVLSASDLIRRGASIRNHIYFSALGNEVQDSLLGKTVEQLEGILEELKIAAFTLTIQAPPD